MATLTISQLQYIDTIHQLGQPTITEVAGQLGFSRCCGTPFWDHDWLFRRQTARCVQYSGSAVSHGADKGLPGSQILYCPASGSFFNLQIHKIFQQVMWLASSDPVRQYWKAQFGHTPPDFANSDGTPKGRIHRSGFGSGGSGGAASLFGAALTASGNRCTRITFKDHRGEII